MVKGTGVDIIEISRIARAGQVSDRFVPRVFRAAEVAYCEKKKDMWASMAARFAAKEAVIKAIGPGFGSISLNDIEVVMDEGRPGLKLHGTAREAAARRGIESFALSLSHSRDYAVAFVIAY